MGKNTTPRKFDGAIQSPYQVKDAANAYYALSCILTDTMPDDKEEVEKAGYTLATIGASATNRFLALELYFKAIFIGMGGMFIGTHDLQMLFSELPREHRNLIQNSFAQKRQVRNTVDVNWHVTVLFRIGANLQLERPTVDLSDDTLETLLERNKDGFVDWRYVFQHAKASAPTTYTYEYRALGLLCDILREVLDSGLQDD